MENEDVHFDKPHYNAIVRRYIATNIEMCEKCKGDSDRKAASHKEGKLWVQVKTTVPKNVQMCMTS